MHNPYITGIDVNMSVPNGDKSVHLRLELSGDMETDIEKFKIAGRMLWLELNRILGD